MDLDVNKMSDEELVNWLRNTEEGKQFKKEINAKYNEKKINKHEEIKNNQFLLDRFKKYINRPYKEKGSKTYFYLEKYKTIEEFQAEHEENFPKLTYQEIRFLHDNFDEINKKFYKEYKDKEDAMERKIMLLKMEEEEIKRKEQELKKARAERIEMIIFEGIPNAILILFLTLPFWATILFVLYVIIAIPLN